MREHHIQLRRRLDSVKRIHRASGELEDRVGELEQAEEALARRPSRALEREVAAIDAVVDAPDGLPAAANG